MEMVTIKAAMVLPSLLLQKPYDHVYHQSRRLDLWLEGEIEELLSEGRSIQHQLKTSNSSEKLVELLPPPALELIGRLS